MDDQEQILGRVRPSRREMMAGATGVLAMTNLSAAKAATPVSLRAPSGFLWGTAISAHQSEGNNVNSDAWLLEHATPSAFAEPSGDACDSYNRYEQDLDLAASLGLNCYRFGIEWARIEPEPGRFSEAELDHYVRVLEACHARKLMPMVTYNHFTVPRWFAERGGFEVADAADLFARFAGRATEKLGPLIGMASTFNEANIALLLRLLRGSIRKQSSDTIRDMIAFAAHATGSPKFSSLMFGNPDVITTVMLDAHAKASAAMKAGPGNFPVGVTLSMQDIQGVGPDNIAHDIEKALYGGWIDAARKSDFVGVQTYTRLRVDNHGIMAPPAGAEMTAAGYEYYPAAVGATLRYAAREIGRPIYLTETGIATENDARRATFIDETIAEVRNCIDQGIDVKSYIYWSLLDNFEWTAGYAKHFGLASVDLSTFRRTLKPSAQHLAHHAKINRL